MPTRKKAKRKTAKPARKKAKSKAVRKPPKVEAAPLKDGLWISYERLDEIVFAPRNSKNHDVGLLTQSIDRFGFVEPPAINETTGRLVTGHGRIKGLRARKQAGQPLPEKVKISDDGEWLAPVIRGNTFPTDQEAEAYLLTSNRSTQIGGYHDAELVSMLEDHAAQTDGLLGTGYDFDDLEFYKERLGNVDEVEFPDLPSGEKGDFQQMTFVVHDDQAEIIKEAIAAAKSEGPFVGPNESSNGNALARIAERALNAIG